ncbi:hypothetical protein Tco_0512145 [Tanacetum coccineum]
MQLKQEIFQNDEFCVTQNTVEIQEYFEINDLKARLQDKDTTICKLNDTIKSLRKNTKDENVNHDKCELEPINEELENSVAKLLSENEHLCNEINHVKHVFKDQFDSIKQTCVRHKEHSDSLINKLNLKFMENGDLKAQIQDKVFVITSLKNDLRKSKGKEIVENTVHLPSATTTIASQAYTCPNAITPSTKKVVVTPMNNVKKVRFAEPLTSSSNIKQPPSNKKECNRISQTPSRNKKNKVEAQPRKVNKMNRVVKPVCDVDVKQSLSNANSDILCATCNKSMFDGVHDKFQDPGFKEGLLLHPLHDSSSNPTLWTPIAVSPIKKLLAPRDEELADSTWSPQDRGVLHQQYSSSQEHEHSPNHILQVYE